MKAYNIKKDMNEQPKVSVVMSIYNGQKYICEAVESILNQTFSNFEFIVINDASTDKTLKILNEYASKDSRIILVNNNINLGLTKSLNKGLKLAKGKYIARQDADDISENERLLYEVNFLDNNPEIALVGTRVFFIDHKGRNYSTWEMPLNHKDIANELSKVNSFCHGSVMFRREVLTNIGSYREQFRCTQDYDYWLRISEHYKVANIDKFLYKFRRVSNTISRKKLNEQLNYHLLAIALAKERAVKGFDSIEQIKIDTIEEILNNKYGFSNESIKAFKQEYLFSIWISLIRNKKYLDAFEIWIKYFLLEPRKWKIKIFLQNILESI